jgi:hypothetical protein
MAGDAVVQADHHHSPTARPLLMELVEFVLQCLLIGSRIPAFEREETMSFMWKVQGTATKSPPLTGTMKG